VAEVELPDPEELEERAERTFSRRVALTTAVYAVALAIASLGGSNAMKEMLLAQQQSSDQWAFYQAKVIRERAGRRIQTGGAREAGGALQEARRRRETLQRREEGHPGPLPADLLLQPGLGGGGRGADRERLLPALPAPIPAREPLTLLPLPSGERAG